MPDTLASQTNTHRQKLARLFSLLDADGDGRVSEGDYAAMAERIAKVFGHAADSAIALRLRSVLCKLWHVVHDHPRLGRDGIMTLTQMNADHCRDILQGPLGTDVIRPLSLALLQTVDPAGTGCIPTEDLTKLLVLGFGVSEQDIGHLAAHMDQVLRYREVHRLVADFFFSADPRTPGSLLLGPLPVGACP